jgi:non-heme chloroperoxidase
MLPNNGFKSDAVPMHLKPVAKHSKMRPPMLLKAALVIAIIFVGALAMAIAFGGPKMLPSMVSINDPFKSVDFADLPPSMYFTANEGVSLAYRYYSPSGAQPEGSVVLVHGSSASSNSMHVLAKAFAQAGLAAYALDIRGHGASGTKGKIAYIGQLEDDIDAFTHAVAPVKPSTLVGFSSGGGFVLRFASSARQDQFQSYLLLSPFLSHHADNYRPGSGGWADVGVPRIIALSILNSLGVHSFNDLPVTRFALSEDAKKFLTPEYSFALAVNFQPHRDYLSDIRSVHQSCAVIAGMSDEVFYTDKLEEIFRKQGKDWPVLLLPGIGHITLTLEPHAVQTVVKTVKGLQASGV